jgi:hypothetical protein
MTLQGVSRETKVVIVNGALYTVKAVTDTHVTVQMHEDYLCSAPCSDPKEERRRVKQESEIALARSEASA